MDYDFEDKGSVYLVTELFRPNDCGNYIRTIHIRVCYIQYAASLPDLVTLGNQCLQRFVRLHNVVCIIPSNIEKFRDIIDDYQYF